MNSLVNKGKLSKVLGGTLWLTVSTLIVKLLGVIYKIPLTQFLGEEGMGYFNSAYTVYGFFYLLCTAGVPKAVMIIVSEQKKKREHIEKIIRTAVTCFFALGIAITLLFVLLSAPISNIIGSSNARYTMIAVAPSIIFISIAGVVRGYLSAEMSFGIIAVSQIIEGVSKLVLGLVFAIGATMLKMPLKLISAMTILGVTLGAFFGLVYLLICSKISKFANNSRQKCNFAESKAICARILRISVPITLSAAVMSITGIIDLTLIMRRLVSIGYSEAAAVALYGNYTTLVIPMLNLATAIISPISVTFLPVFASAKATGDAELLKSSLKSSLDLTAVVCAPIMLGMFVYAKEILTLLFGNIGISTGSSLLRLAVAGIFFMSVLLILNSALEAHGHVKAPMISMLVGALVKTVISYFLIGNDSFGISGAPIGTVISYAASLTVSMILMKRNLTIDVPLLKTFLPPFACAIAATIMSRVIYNRAVFKTGNTTALILAILICAAIYISLLILCGIFSRKKIEEMSKYTKFA